ncbi:MAG TPA: 8-amino-7-oxononanoate synthase [Chryseolinea sp.]|nr:8-amino-7-oxononanoate synthase [Chryseolinea sp.]HPH46192.1 8-amino-7-oxononanoate synthase [Chryseolinea sp.]HPM30046.1 8-amino-7-oxononanoate synthase [Chryseolinea sp.]
MDPLQSVLIKQLAIRETEGARRFLKEDQHGSIDFTSNDYLGLARSPELFKAIKQRLNTIDFKSNGSTGSRLLSGNSNYAEQIENKLAGIFKSEAALIFNSGYTANLGVLSSLPQRGDTILYDELAHACMKDGARLSLAKRFNFRHNDLNDLESKLKLATGKIFIAVESIYSMDGDQCPLKDLVTLSEKYGASIILDEAHSTGVLGSNGAGLAVSLGLEEKIAIRIYTFGKGMGIHGACVAGSTILKDYLINFARPFIYTTALPPHSLVSIECAFDFLVQNLSLQQLLHKKIDHFIHELKSVGETSTSMSSIQSILIGGNERTKRMAEALQQKGFDVRPIVSPTVSKGTERLRVCLHTFNSNEEISNLIQALSALKLF